MPDSISHTSEHSLTIRNNGKTLTFDGRGVSDLYRLLTTSPETLHGAEATDKVVGKGAAALMILGGVRSLHAGIISTPALQMLSKAEMDVTYGEEVPNIKNMRGDGICPVEQLCLKCTTAEECLPLISGFIQSKMKD